MVDPGFHLKLREVAEGLYYLHSFGVVHGDLKGVSLYEPPLNPFKFNPIFATLQLDKCPGLQKGACAPI
jgi:hypothetical protein